ncbi:hypothetical protein AMELA_G00154810 [Ameiurus melas]|uniref:SOSS complex subunit C n=1 Tax=Ameiurus melas TaxID=219545 RepID=A0A7J6ALG6_AMEME|nr:hypothetical protein AMELA_G00154810 [Ameiurus melas]
MASNPPGQGFPNKNRVAILAELDKEKRRLIQSQSMNNPGASIPLSRPPVKEFRDHAEQQHIAAQQKAALQHAHAHSSGFFITQDSSFGNLIPNSSVVYTPRRRVRNAEDLRELHPDSTVFVSRLKYANVELVKNMQKETGLIRF